MYIVEDGSNERYADAPLLSAPELPWPMVARVATRLVETRLGLAGREVVGARPCAIFCSVASWPCAMISPDAAMDASAHGQRVVAARRILQQLGGRVEFDDPAGVQHEDARKVGAGAMSVR